MTICEVSSNVAATPETIWETCFAHMKWELWDTDLNAVKDVSGDGGCEEGTTCIFAMADGNDIPITLSNVAKNQSVDFKGGILGGMVRAEGKVRITTIDSMNSKIDYSFEMTGCLGKLVGCLNSKAVVGGTEHGLANMIEQSEEAQKKK